MVRHRNVHVLQLIIELVEFDWDVVDSRRVCPRNLRMREKVRSHSDGLISPQLSYPIRVARAVKDEIPARLDFLY